MCHKDQHCKFNMFSTHYISHRHLYHRLYEVLTMPVIKQTQISTYSRLLESGHVCVSCNCRCVTLLFVQCPAAFFCDNVTLIYACVIIIIIVVSTLAQSYLHASGHSAAGAAELAVSRKEAKHPTNHIIGHIGDGFLRIKWPNHQRQSTEWRS